MCFYVVLMIILIPTLVLFLIPLFNAGRFHDTERCSKASDSIEILTDRKVYSSNDKITLIIKNNSGKTIYLEPCEYLNKFERKVGKKWMPENRVISNIVYDKSSFNRRKGAVKCKIDPPTAGKGTYRVVVKVYYNCEKPGYDACRNSKVFYSNGFRLE